VVEIKGLSVIDSVEAVRRRDGQKALDRITQLLSDDAKRLVQGQLLPNAWYPLDAFVQFLEVDIQVTARGNSGVLVARAETVIEHQLRGIYKVFARLSSAQSLLKRLATIQGTYFRNADIRFMNIGDGQATVEYAGFCERHRIMRPVLIGFYRKALEICGVKVTSVDFVAPGPDGEPSWTLNLAWH